LLLGFWRRLLAAGYHEFCQQPGSADAAAHRAVDGSQAIHPSAVGGENGCMGAAAQAGSEFPPRSLGERLTIEEVVRMRR
jgi:hypothetical protein